MAGTQLIADYLTKSITVRASWDRFRAFTNLLKVEKLGGGFAGRGGIHGAGGEACCVFGWVCGYDLAFIHCKGGGGSGACDWVGL